MKLPTRALYLHPAFVPHRLLRWIGVRRFWVQNLTFTLVLVVALTLAVWKDHSFIITNGYGYIEHPGVFGWYLVQLIMPVSIYATLKAAAKSRKHYQAIISHPEAIEFRERVFKPMVKFVGLRTRLSQSVFALLFTLGFAGFALNSWQNLAPGRLAPLDFWDSIHFPFGYFTSRAHKFYVHALLLPSIVHIFTGIVWAHLKAIRFFSKRNEVRLSPFNPDGSGGFGFLADLILTPTISALLVSGLAFLGVIYTHRAFDITTVVGILVQVAILLVFYVAPTFILRSVLLQVKKLAWREIQVRQEEYYEEILSGNLHGESLREAHEYLTYFNDISARIDRIPDWPHLTKVSRVFGISISPAAISLILNAGSVLRKAYLGPP